MVMADEPAEQAGTIADTDVCVIERIERLFPQRVAYSYAAVEGKPVPLNCILYPPLVPPVAGDKEVMVIGYVNTGIFYCTMIYPLPST
jgi:hypothetical protein